MKTYDAIIVGSGATGGWAAMELTASGMDVLVLEAGSELADPRAAMADGAGGTDDAEGWKRSRPIQSHYPMCDKDRYPFFIDDTLNPYTTPSDRPFDWIRIRHVGGRSLLWGRFVLRLSDYEFKAASRDGIGIDWPLCYADLEPYYDRVEEFFGVSGTKEGIANLPDGRYTSAARMTAGESMLKSMVEARWPERRVIPGRAIPIQRRTDIESAWDSFTSPGSTLAVARATGRLTVRPGAVVRSVVVDPSSGKAHGVSFVDQDSRQEEVVRADLVILAASTIETVRILLNSASTRHPDGVGNSSGTLGRYLIGKGRILLGGRAPRLSTRDMGPAFGGENLIYIPRFRNLENRHPDFVRGYGIVGGVQRAGMTAICPSDEDVPFLFSMHCEQLPRAENQVTLDREEVDELGIAVPHIDCSYSANEVRMAADAMQFADEMAEIAGFEPTVRMDQLTNPGWMIHEVGGARMGDDPRTSVLDRFNQVWDCPNLFVVDGAAWPSSGCQNPTLTMIAIAARACDNIVTQRRRGDL